jgi:hypothetical protein
MATDRSFSFAANDDCALSWRQHLVRFGWAIGAWFSGLLAARMRTRLLYTGQAG